MSHLIEEIKPVPVLGYQATGQTDPDSAVVDMQGYDGVMFVLHLGAVDATGTITMAAKQAATSIVGDALSGASVAGDAADDDKLLVLDVLRPTDRYLSVTITRAVADSVINGVVAFLYKARDLPVAVDTDNLGATPVTVVTPDES